ncbi:MAG: hypothetical protein U0T73_02330 [Chitinophagales bacterium]
MELNKILLIITGVLFVGTVVLKTIWEVKGRTETSTDRLISRLPVMAFLLVLAAAVFSYFRTHQKVEEDTAKTTAAVEAIDSLSGLTATTVSEAIAIDSTSSAMIEAPQVPDTMAILNAIKKADKADAAISKVVEDTREREKLVGGLSGQLTSLNSAKLNLSSKRQELVEQLALAKRIDVCVFYFEERGKESFDKAVQAAKILDALNTYNVRVKKISTAVNARPSYDIHHSEIRYNKYQDSKDETEVAKRLKAVIEASGVEPEVTLRSVPFDTPWYISVFIY